MGERKWKCSSKLIQKNTNERVILVGKKDHTIKIKTNSNITGNANE